MSSTTISGVKATDCESCYEASLDVNVELMQGFLVLQVCVPWLTLQTKTCA